MNKKLIVLFSVIFLAGVFLIGNGVTGLYMLELNKMPCNENSDCAQSDVCCFFSNEDFGVCDLEKECPAIERASFEAGKKMTNSEFAETSFESNPSLLSSHIETPAKPKAVYSAIAGILLVFISFTGYFIGKVRDIHYGKSRHFFRHS